jgi:hypothetical protein
LSVYLLMLLITGGPCSSKFMLDAWRSKAIHLLPTLCLIWYYKWSSCKGWRVEDSRGDVTLHWFGIPLIQPSIFTSSNITPRLYINLMNSTVFGCAGSQSFQLLGLRFQTGYLLYEVSERLGVRQSPLWRRGGAMPMMDSMLRRRARGSGPCISSISHD